MSLETKLIALTQGIATDIKTLTTNQGDLSSLPTTAKSSLVAAIAEIHGLLGTGGAIIDDNAGNGDDQVTWSADKIFDSIATAIQNLQDSLVNGAGAALDTLKELADALNNDPNFATTIASEIANRVRYDQPQTLNATQRAQACANIGVGNPEVDLLAAYVAAKA